MSSLVAIKVSEEGKVDARGLHEFLGSKRQFANWIQERIEKYEFTEGVNFTVNKFVIGKATQIDYVLSLDMAKELCMVESNEQGRIARKYFIDCEKKLCKLGAASSLMSPLDILEQQLVVARAQEKAIGRLQLVQSEMQSVQASLLSTQLDSPLTVEQRVTLKAKMDRRIKDLELPVECTGLLQNDVKDEFLPPGAHMGDYRWYHIPQKTFEAACSFVEGWFPTEDQRKTGRYHQGNRKPAKNPRKSRKSRGDSFQF